MSKNIIWLLDPGHGGTVNGKYVTPGKRSPVWEDGSQYFEGVGNREIVKKLIKAGTSLGYDMRDIVDSELDISRSTRIARANKITKEEDAQVFYVSVHSDAFTQESARGYSAYTATRASKNSKMLAEMFLDTLEDFFPNNKMRADDADGFKDKSKNFDVIAKTSCPAVLLELFFMTNFSNCKEILMSEEGQNMLVLCLISVIQKVETHGLK
jgi:N-acetylmuramoyl-L-alanine amidase